jgi:hypothetical protein
MKVPVERVRVLLLADHVEVDVGRVAPPELRHDHGRTDRLLALEVAQQKHELPVAPPDLSAVAALGMFEQAAHVLPVVREVDRVQKPRQRDELGLVAARCTADLVTQHRDRRFYHP